MEPQFITGLIVGFTSILLGTVVCFLKLDWIIAGYNTLTKQQKKNVDIKKLRGLFLLFFGLVGIGILLNILISLVANIKFIHPLTILFFVVLFFVINYNIGKYDHNKGGAMVSVYWLFHKN